MRLLAHPESPRGPVRNVEAHADYGADEWLRLSWRLDADLTQLSLPPASAPARGDGLWRHTCFEAFISGTASPAYWEFNFSPSGQWAAYGFTGYRAGRIALDPATAPRIMWRRAVGHVELAAAVRLDEFMTGPGQGPLRLGLAAVIEEQSGAISYWALRHPQDKPDFHHPEGFTFALAGLTSAAAGGGASRP
jgi:hypothetical protein